MFLCVYSGWLSFLPTTRLPLPMLTVETHAWILHQQHTRQIYHGNVYLQAQCFRVASICQRNNYYKHWSTGSGPFFPYFLYTLQRIHYVFLKMIQCFGTVKSPTDYCEMSSIHVPSPRSHQPRDLFRNIPVLLVRMALLFLSLCLFKRITDYFTGNIATDNIASAIFICDIYEHINIVSGVVYRFRFHLPFAIPRHCNHNQWRRCYVLHHNNRMRINVWLKAEFMYSFI